MKTVLLIFTAAFTLVPPVVRAQMTSPGSADIGWSTRIAALEEERASQAGVAVSIVFDDSGSMADNKKMPMAKQAFRTWIASAPASYRFGLTALNAGRLTELNRDNKAQILAAVDRLKPGGDTPLASTIAKVGKEIIGRRSVGSPYERQVMVVLTDGEDNTRRGPKGVQEEMQRLRAQQVEVIAFGYQGEGQYMRDSATRFFSPDNAQDIQRGLSVIAAEIGDTSDVVVDDATRARMEHPLPTATPASSAATNTNAAVTPPPSLATPLPTAPSGPVTLTTSTERHHIRLMPTIILIGIFYFLFGRNKRK